MVKLVVADDHTVIREALCDLLQRKGNYSVVAQVSNGEELLEAIQQSTPDIVIMDVSMPCLDGIGALEKMNQVNYQVPVLILSANDGERNVRSVLRAGAKGFMPKNASLEELQFAIASILEGKTYLSPSITAQFMSEPGADGLPESPLSVLTKREIEVLKHLADGKSNRQIGKLLHISIRTVDTHRSNILKKLNLKTNAELTKLAIANGLISV